MGEQYADDIPDGCRSGSGGFLRRTVDVQEFASTWRLRHSIWELEVPALQTAEEPEIRAFFERRRPVQELQLHTEGTKRLLQLLASQGCITYDTRSDYTLDEIRFLVGALSSTWYGNYYSHPLWKELTECRLSTQQVFGWVLRTYHLSRSAGPTAARGAVNSPARHIALTFLKSALEEYSHCDIYYFPSHPLFGLDAGWIKSLLPLPSSTAFDQHMAVMAEDDWLAHAVSAYFQEYTAAFRDKAFTLYHRLESAYGLEGFFKGWKDHIGYDVDQTHADEFADLFRGAQRVGRRELLCSLGTAAMTVEYLMGALDEVMEMARKLEIKQFRVSPALIGQGAMGTTVLGGFPTFLRLLEPETPLALGEFLVHSLVDDPKTLRLVGKALSETLPRSSLSALHARALGLSIEHDDSVLLGRLLEASYSAYGAPDSADLHCEHHAGARAIQNFLRETAREPTHYLFLIGLCDLVHRHLYGRTTGDFLPSALRTEWARRFSISANVHQRRELATVCLQFLELCDASTRRWNRLDPQDVL